MAADVHAAAFGDSLLREVSEENLAELLHSVRALTTPHPQPHPGLGIKPLDALLRLFHPNPHPPPVHEKTSPPSPSGKSHLLYHLTALAILPATHNSIPLPGASSAVIYLDTDSRFDPARLHTVAVNIVHASAAHHDLPISHEGEAEAEAEAEVHAMVHNAMRHVHVFRPQSSAALLATVNSLERYLVDGTGHVSSERRVHAVLLDSASAFYWQDRREAEVVGIPGVREERARDENEEGLSVTQTAREIVSGLRRVQRVFGCAVVFTTWGVQNQNQNQNQRGYGYGQPLSFRPHLPHPWPGFANCRVVVAREAVNGFPPGMSAEEARESGDAAKRQGVVRRGVFRGWVDRWGSERWERRVWEGLERDGNGVFGFEVTEEGVRI
ncbi:hypothetical protein FQN53_006988 [Emmonsiellopsis sp. PD_33]|nr:hypothetical protein FQN53_006988 [Emmonsiellopsis sp. PD_33]